MHKDSIDLWSLILDLKYDNKLLQREVIMATDQLKSAVNRGLTERNRSTTEYRL